MDVVINHSYTKVEGGNGMRWRVVETDNHGSDYPDEKFVGPSFYGPGHAKAVCEACNSEVTDSSPRFYKVVQLPYTLQPGFEP